MTNLYLAGPDRWTGTPELALDFRFADRARAFAQTWELGTVEVAVVYEEGPQVRSVRLGDCARQ